MTERLDPLHPIFAICEIDLGRCATSISLRLPCSQPLLLGKTPLLLDKPPSQMDKPPLVFGKPPLLLHKPPLVLGKV